MSLFSCLLCALAVAVLAVVAMMACASTRPDEFPVERRPRIAAPAGRRWPLVGVLRGFNRWSPCS